MLVTENTQKYDDALNKFKVLEGDLERAYERLTNAQAKVDRLEDEAKQVNTDLKDLETRDEEASQREMSLEDQVRYLDVQVKETDQRADQAERMAARLERLRDTINGTSQQNLRNTVERYCFNFILILQVASNLKRRKLRRQKMSWKRL